MLDNGVVMLHNGGMAQTTTPAPQEATMLTPCPDCHGRLADEAFAPVGTLYARCTRCGHVFHRAAVSVIA